jgi:uncharacterized protein YndB with AHSA1/START domain
MTSELRLKRVIDAPPDAVFEAFTTEAGQEAFYGQDDPGWIVESDCDLRVGGVWTITFGAARNHLYRHRHVFDVIERPRRIVLATTESRPDGSSFDFTIEFTFEEQGGSTLIPRSRPASRPPNSATNWGAAWRTPSPDSNVSSTREAEAVPAGAPPGQRSSPSRLPDEGRRHLNLPQLELHTGASATRAVLSRRWHRQSAGASGRATAESCSLLRPLKQPRRSVADESLRLVDDELRHAGR